MSYTEKPDEITKDEWMEKLNNLHVQRADMNRLIMNYLVTGNEWLATRTWASPFAHTVRILPPKYHGKVIKMLLT